MVQAHWREEQILRILLRAEVELGDCYVFLLKAYNRMVVEGFSLATMKPYLLRGLRFLKWIRGRGLKFESLSLEDINTYLLERRVGGLQTRQYSWRLEL